METLKLYLQAFKNLSPQSKKSILVFAGVVVFIVFVIASMQSRPTAAAAAIPQSLPADVKQSEEPVNDANTWPSIAQQLYELGDSLEHYRKPIEIDDQAAASNRTLFYELGQEAIDSALLGDDKKLQDKAHNFQPKLTALQRSELPFLRKTFAADMAHYMWVKDIYVTMGGTNNEILNITGSAFATNANIKKMEDLYIENFVKLRFKQIRYRWYQGEGKYQYFIPTELSDGDKFK